MDGHEIRMRRIMDMDSGMFILVPMDHGVSLGPVKGIIDFRDAVNRVHAGGATAVVLHKGLVSGGMADSGGRLGLIMHISASTCSGPSPDSKVLVGSVEEAIMVGADAVSVHVNVGAESEREMLSDLGLISSQCRRWRIPLLAMIYNRGKNVKDPLDPEGVAHAARIGAELGADLIKTSYTGDIDSFGDVCRGCPVPVVIAGGPRMDTDREVLEMIRDSVKAGGRGISIGRNIFQHKDPAGMVRAVRGILIEGRDVEESLDLIGGSGK